ncbi:hypothetical protein CK203_002896 [Vitis vinifera]|uniref:Uncharacterized protein n=1 Tax=Vitis vinifera TaxID=29760 RepID=A0A438KH00_VITVI|nr:hypothetical protein CK203_002896 [Vitis vinifera]
MRTHSTKWYCHSLVDFMQILFWDWRNKKQVACLEDSHVDDVTQVSDAYTMCWVKTYGVLTVNVVEIGLGLLSRVLFWRMVHFVPSDKNKLVSASVDGLICTFDTVGDINDDDHLESAVYRMLGNPFQQYGFGLTVTSIGNLEKDRLCLRAVMLYRVHFKNQVINVDTSIGKVGFLGDTYQKLWCLTHIETLSVWDWKEARIEANFQDARSLASDSWTLDRMQDPKFTSGSLEHSEKWQVYGVGSLSFQVGVNYFVDCHYSGDDQRLWVIGGTNAGTLGYFPVNYQGMGAIGPPEAVLEGGHTGVVRSVLPMSSKQIGTAQSQGIFGWTGGEDGRLCCWFSDGSPETNRSWISSEFVMKSPRTCKKNRHLPY